MAGKRDRLTKSDLIGYNIKEIPSSWGSPYHALCKETFLGCMSKSSRCSHGSNRTATAGTRGDDDGRSSTIASGAAQKPTRLTYWLHSTKGGLPFVHLLNTRLVRIGLDDILDLTAEVSLKSGIPKSATLWFTTSKKQTLRAGSMKMHSISYSGHQTMNTFGLLDKNISTIPRQQGEHIGEEVL